MRTRKFDFEIYWPLNWSIIYLLFHLLLSDGYYQKKVNVWIGADKDKTYINRERGAESLLEEFKNKYFAPTLLPRNSDRIDIKFLQLDYRDERETSRIDYMNQKIESISTKEGENALNIIMIDEMCPAPIDDIGPKENATGGLEHDWSDLKCNQENVFLLVAFNPCSTKRDLLKGVY